MREENTHPCEAGKKSYNIRKNRFKDILPCKCQILIYLKWVNGSVQARNLK